MKLEARRALRALAAVALAASAPACTYEFSGTDFGYTITGTVDNTGATGPEYCALPGATSVPLAVVPEGLCIRQYARVPVARVMAFAPNGDLFVSSPVNTSGGARGGSSSIVLLRDSDNDGVAESTPFVTNVPSVHGVALRGAWLYFTTGDGVWRTAYRPGITAEDTSSRTRIGTYDTLSTMRSTHGLTVSPNGTLYTSVGVNSELNCPDTPREGSVRTLNESTGSLSLVAEGFRNPMYVRCHPTNEVCLAAELGDDGGRSYGAREKLVRLRADTNYGFPCCSTTGGFSSYNVGNAYDCARTTREEQSFPLGDTPFGFDWERGRWPEPFRNSLFVAMHGSFYTSPRWQGARVSFSRTDAQNLPTGEWRDVLRGFGPGGSALDRPSDAAFSPDGRLFVADDQGGYVYWIAPTGLRAPAGG